MSIWAKKRARYKVKYWQRVSRLPNRSHVRFLTRVAYAMYTSYDIRLGNERASNQSRHALRSMPSNVREASEMSIVRIGRITWHLS